MRWRIMLRAASPMSHLNCRSDMPEPVFALCYDIARDATRRRVAALLEGEMVRVQDSVFEARLTPVAARRLFEQATAMVDDGDRIRLYALTAPGLAQCAVHGGPPLPEDEGYWLL